MIYIYLHRMYWVDHKGARQYRLINQKLIGGGGVHPHFAAHDPKLASAAAEKGGKMFY